ncbi:hypothetical protein CHS0354_030924 [Potamilus streckersoni]|uniref:Uncharacterized protein n=1 Tax=Potamilus streckersoni TaxID=2493646 RepID=A0AAE0RUZ7_9BIVA|nr:hypothetical protein CHS0354_030924 [Potamilus streckersoni]
MYRPTLSVKSPTIPNHKRKNIEQEPTLSPTTHHLIIPNVIPHTDPHGHDAKLDKADNPVPNQTSNLNKKSKTEDGKNSNILEPNSTQPKLSDSGIFKNQPGRKVRFARDNQTPGQSKTHTKEELQEIRQALDNFNLTRTNTHTSLNILTEFEDIRTLPKGKQPIRGPPKGKNSESAAISQGSNTPSTLYQSHSNQQNTNTTKRKCLDCQPNKYVELERRKQLVQPLQSGRKSPGNRISHFVTISKADWDQFQNLLRYVRPTDFDQTNRGILHGIHNQIDTSRQGLHPQNYWPTTHIKTLEFLWTPSHLNLKGNDTTDIAAKRGLELPIITQLPPSVSETLYNQNLLQQFYGNALGTPLPKEDSCTTSNQKQEPNLLLQQCSPDMIL